MKTMIQSIKISFLLAVCLIFLGSGCRKEFRSDKGEKETFLRVLSRDSSHAILSVQEGNNGEFLLVENFYNDVMNNFIRINGRGSIAERLKFDQPNSGGGVWWSTKMKSGDIVYTQLNGDYMLRYNSEAQLKYGKKLLTVVDNHLSFPAFESENGEVFIPTSSIDFGGYGCTIVRLDASGNIVDRHKIDMGADLLSLEHVQICEIRGDTLLLVASTRPYFQDNVKAKLVSIVYDLASAKLITSLKLDLQDDSESDMIISAVPNEKGLACLTSGNPGFYVASNTPSPEFELFFMDHNGKLIKRRRYGFSIYNCVPSKMVRTQDGGYLIAGHVNSTRTDHFFGFMMKLSAQGEVEASRIFDETQMVIFDCMETRDGHFVFGGASLSFGSGRDYVDALVLKTNREGKIE